MPKSGIYYKMYASAVMPLPCTVGSLANTAHHHAQVSRALLLDNLFLISTALRASRKTQEKRGHAVPVMQSCTGVSTA